MKSKSLSVLVIIFVLCTCMFSLVACEETPIVHTHNYATLKYDNESHWFECECEDKSNVTLHDIKNGECACGYVVPHSIQYEVSDSGTYAEVVAYSGTPTIVNIASTYNGLPVTGISSYAFSGCSSLTSITIPDSVTTIGDCTFDGCSSLTSITIPDSVTSIGYWAFYGCSSLTEITLPFVGGSKDATTASSSTLFGYIFGTSSYTGSTAITQFYSNTFYTTYYIPTSLKKVTITGGNILFGAFFGCRGLTSITILDSVTSIGSGAFSGCSSLSEITLPFVGSSKTSTLASSSALFGYIFGTSSYTGSTATTQYYYLNNFYITYYIPTSLKKVTITGGNIPFGAFANCSGLTSVAIGKNVTYIDSYAFMYCSGLTSVTIPDSVTSIGKRAFSGCSSLTSVTIPDSVTSIGSDAFSGCSSLTSITIPDSVTSIGKGAFSDCSGLIKVNYMGTIDQWAEIEFDSVFANPLYYAKHLYINDELVTEVNLTTATKVSAYAFRNCSSLTSVTIGNSVTTIGIYAFSDCSGLTSVTIGDSVTSIGSYAFQGCNGLTSIAIGKNVTSIGSYAFYGCSSLTSITIPNSVTSIGYDAFAHCSGLTSVTMGDGVTTIGDYAFSGCYKLVEIYNKSSLNIVTGSASHGYIGYYAKNIYTPTSGESKLSNDNGYIIYTDGNEKILVGYSGTETDLILPSCVTKIYQYAFSNCSSLTSVTIPDSVTSIGSYAFEDCSSLTSITIPDSVTSIGDYAFYDCSSLTSIIIPDSVTSIGSYAFEDCSSLTYTIAGNLKYLGNSNNPYLYLAGTTSTSITTATINSNCKLISSYAFYGCSGLTSVTIPDSVTSIGYDAFAYCSSLTSVVIGDSVTSIGYFAFYNCSSLTSITIPDSVTSISDYAFYGCRGLTSITIPDGITTIASSAFSGCYKLVEIYNKSSLNIVTGSASHGYIGYYAKNIYTPTSGESKLSNDNGYIIYTDGNEKILVGYSGTETDLILPSCVTKIYQYAFSNCSSLTSVTIPDSVTSIGSYAFMYCSGLTSVTIPNSVTSIGDYAFYACSSLTSITFNETSTWYRTTSLSDWNNKTGGTSTSVTNSSTNATYFKSTYYNYYWYKL